MTIFLNQINVLIKCIGLALTLVLAPAVFCSPNNAKKFLFLLFFLLNAVLCILSGNDSSRYYSIMIVCSILFVSNFATTIHSFKHCYCLLLILIVLLQAYETHSSSNNTYLLDIQETGTRFSLQNPKTTHLIQEKEYTRISSKLPGIANKFPNDLSSFNDTQISYSLWHDPFICYIKGKDYQINEIKKNHLDGFNLKTIASFNCYRNTKYNLILYEQSFDYTTPINKEDYKKSNLIRNGEMEILEDSVEAQRKIESWIGAGATFYQTSKPLLPKYEMLLQTWRTNSNNNYPEVYLDEESPINGKYSLNVRFKKDNYIFFLYKIPAVPGQLTFSIRSLDSDSIVCIGRSDYDAKDTFLLTPMHYYIRLSDNKTHYYSIRMKKEDYLGVRTLFNICASNTHILLDDIAFYPD